ncbi:MAG TPA: YqjD family protein [Methylophilus sp.]
MEKLMNEVSKEQLVNDFKVVVADAEALLKATASQSGEKFAEMRAKTEQSLSAARAKLADAQSVVVAKTKDTAKATDVYVHDNPWKAIGIAAGVGLVIGVLISRK